MSVGDSAHWESVYREKPAQGVSWYRPHLEFSLRLLQAHGLHAGSRLIDVGGGASTLIDDVLALGVSRPTVLDLAAAALDVSRSRLGERAIAVDWCVGDIATVELERAAYSHWHDRAVLHFLIDENEARAYARQAAHALGAGGIAVIGGFAPDGPLRCSGLEVARRSPEQIAALLGPSFQLLQALEETHLTPAGNPQRFAWAVLRRD